MSAILGLILILVIAYAGSVYVFAKENLPGPLRYLFYSGWEFMLVGMALGPLGLNFFPEQMLAALDPLMHLGLGWVGLLLGVQLNIRDLSRVNRAHLSITLWQAFLSGLVTALALMPILHSLAGWDARSAFSAALAIAASAAISAPTVLLLMKKETGFKERLIRLLTLITNLDAVVAVLAAGMIFIFVYQEVPAPVRFAIMAQSVFIGILLGITFYLLPREKLSGNERFSVLLGFVFFGSGVGGVLQVSPLFMNMVCGFFLANVLRKDDKLYSTLFSVEKPFYLVLLVLSGLLFSTPSGYLLWAVPVTITVRLFAKYFLLPPLAGRYEPEAEFPPNGGLTLVSQGAMALVVGFAYLTVYPGEAGREVFSVIVLCVMINEMAAPLLASRVFKGML